MVVRAPADGYTLIVNSVGPIAVNPTLYRKLAYNPLTELVPIVQIAEVPNVLVVHPSLPVKTFEEFVAHAKANPGKLNYCVHRHRHQLAPVRLHARQARRLRSRRTCRTRAPTRCNDLLAGRVQFMFATIPSVHPAHRGRQAARAGGHQRQALAFAARRADGRRERLSPASRPARGSASSRPRARRER